MKFIMGGFLLAAIIGWVWSLVKAAKAKTPGVDQPK
jgi:hypothetical protein